MSNAATEKAIASDLEKIDLILALGDRNAKRKARAHRKACFAELARINAEEFPEHQTDEQILAELFA